MAVDTRLDLPSFGLALAYFSFQSSPDHQTTVVKRESSTLPASTAMCCSSRDRKTEKRENAQVVSKESRKRSVQSSRSTNARALWLQKA